MQVLTTQDRIVPYLLTQNFSHAPIRIQKRSARSTSVTAPVPFAPAFEHRMPPFSSGIKLVEKASEAANYPPALTSASLTCSANYPPDNSGHKLMFLSSCARPLEEASALE
jgi:hypothetical protein